MIARKTLFLSIFLLCAFHALCATSLAEHFKQAGYVEICDKKQEAATFDSLYAYFDELIEFLQTNPVWAQKLYSIKERFIRSKDRNYYSTNFFGFYDESKRAGRGQISFYYSTHFHEFLCSRYPEFNQAPEIISFFEACREIQKPYGSLFEEADTVPINFTRKSGILFRGRIPRIFPTFFIESFPHILWGHMKIIFL